MQNTSSLKYVLYGLLLVALMMMPSLVNLVARRRFPGPGRTSSPSSLPFLPTFLHA